MASNVARGAVAQGSSTSTSGGPNPAETTFPYDISIDLKIDIPTSECDSDKTMAAASITLLGDVFTRCPEWSFLATPMLRALDEVLFSTEHKWEPSNDRLVFKKDIRIKGNLVNIKDKPTETSPTFDKLSYNGCVHSSKVLLDYKIEFHFLAGLLSAQRVYEAHEWRRNDTSQDDDSRSSKLREILNHHRGRGSLNHEYTWKEAFFFEGNIKEGKKNGIKRKHQDDE
ncbi:uncharacterized protein LOC107045498 [Diachasma alloeum]|uniref:uncharacterized protein LOC107045498 n=1 Tax=Diachasma alloeum TaxID=454923 RepID=UPI0007384045|nr:uncharacterized protein LOC107045498 [Diachasma alloeum]